MASRRIIAEIASTKTAMIQYHAVYLGVQSSLLPPPAPSTHTETQQRTWQGPEYVILILPSESQYIRQYHLSISGIHGLKCGFECYSCFRLPPLSHRGQYRASGEQLPTLTISRNWIKVIPLPSQVYTFPAQPGLYVSVGPVLLKRG